MTTHLEQCQTNNRINKEIITLNDELDQLHLTDIYRTFYAKTAEFLSTAHRTCKRVNQVLGHKSNVNKTYED